MKKLPYLFIFLLICCKSIAQKNAQKTDSLLLVLPLAKTNTEKADILFALGETYWFSRKIKEAGEYLRQSILLAVATKDMRNYCNAQLLLGYVYMKMGLFDSTLVYLNGCLQCSETNAQPEHIPKAYEGLSLFYHSLGDDEKAIEYGLKSATLFEKSLLPKIKRQSIFAWLSVGRILNKQGQYKKAHEYFSLALQHGEAEKDKNMIVPALIALAGNYYAASDYTSAKDFYQQSYVILKKLEPSETLVDAQQGLGNIAVKEKKYPEAISFFNEGIAVSNERKFLAMLDDLYCCLGNAYLQSRQLDSAGLYFTKSLSEAKKHKHLDLQQELYGQLAILELKKGNKDAAVSFLQQEKKMTDTIYSIEKQKTVSKLEILYQAEKNKKSILVLSEENSQKGTAIDKRNRFIIIISAIAISILFIATLLYRNAQQKKLLAMKETEIKEEEVKLLKRMQQVISLQSMVDGQETERTRIAKDLHDGLGGLFSTVKMYFSTLKHEQEILQENILFSKSYELIDTASEEIRRIAHNMMPEVLMKLGLVPALQDMCNNISAGKLIRVKLQSYGIDDRMNASTEIMLYRIIQELLTNIIKHAKATEAIVQFNKDENRLTVTVEDNGLGFNVLEGDNKKHAGLETIRSRVTYLNGTISIDSQQQVGTTVLMEFILNSEA